MVAMEYALRRGDRLSHLVLADTGGAIRWAQEEAPAELARRGNDEATVELARRFFSGHNAPHERPEQVLAAVREFLRESRPDRTGPRLEPAPGTAEPSRTTSQDHTFG
jgi:pimeloyl-ACP methyl ester carboxylesterase